MGWISTELKSYELGETLKIVAGDTGSILKPYKYDIFICANDNECVLAAEGVSYGKLNGTEISLGDKFAALAFPYNPGRLLTVRAVGTYTSVIGKKYSVTLTNSIYLYGELYPEFTLSLTAKNETASFFGENAVKDYSTLVAKAAVVSINNSGAVSEVVFYGNTISQTVKGSSATEYTAESATVTDVGVKSVSCKVTAAYTGVNPDGKEFKAEWSKTASKTITVKKYSQPYISFNFDGAVKPVRVEDNGSELNIATLKTDSGYKMKFNLRVIANSSLGVTLKTVNTIKCTLISPKLNENENDASVTVNLAPTRSSDGTCYTISYTGKPTFRTEEIGYLIYKKYLIQITVTDSVGTYTLTTALSSLQVTAHLMKGGLGIKIGGYATKDYTVESDWLLLVNNDIEASGKITGDTVDTNGLSFGGGTVYKGVGTSATSLSKGNHAHGNITSDGKLTGGAKGYPLTVDADNNIIKGTDFPYAMYYNITPKMNGAGNEGVLNSIARGDHVHPTDTSRASHTDFTDLRDDYYAFKTKYDGYL